MQTVEMSGKNEEADMHKLIIASNHPLPIRYQPEFNLWFRRGIHPPEQITLPFFVEVDLVNTVHALIHYIEAFKKQYITYEMEFYSKSEDVAALIKVNFPYVIERGYVLYLNHQIDA